MISNVLIKQHVVDPEIFLLIVMVYIELTFSLNLISLLPKAENQMVVVIFFDLIFLSSADFFVFIVPLL